MPYFDGTGPMGSGPNTGWGRGLCGGGTRQGRGWGAGCGYGWRRFISPKNELAALEEEEKMLEEQLAFLREEKKAIKDQEK